MKNTIAIILILLTFLNCKTKKILEREVIEKRHNNFTTYCNPIDIDYSYMSHYAYHGVSYRSGADPSVVR